MSRNGPIGHSGMRPAVRRPPADDPFTAPPTGQPQAPHWPLAATHRRHTRAEAVPALADELAGLIGALHDSISGKTRAPEPVTGRRPQTGPGLYRADLVKSI